VGTPAILHSPGSDAGIDLCADRGRP